MTDFVDSDTIQILCDQSLLDPEEPEKNTERCSVFLHAREKAKANLLTDDDDQEYTDAILTLCESDDE